MESELNDHAELSGGPGKPSPKNNWLLTILPLAAFVLGLWVSMFFFGFYGPFIFLTSFLFALTMGAMMGQGLTSLPLLLAATIWVLIFLGAAIWQLVRMAL